MIPYAILILWVIVLIIWLVKWTSAGDEYQKEAAIDFVMTAFVLTALIDVIYGVFFGMMLNHVNNPGLWENGLDHQAAQELLNWHASNILYPWIGCQAAFFLVFMVVARKFKYRNARD